MFQTSKHRIAATALVGAALMISAGPAAAATPTVETWTGHVERPFIACAGFTTVGAWTINHRLTLFYGPDGVAERDIEAVEFVGEIVNPETGASVPDSGARRYFDTLAPDGSFLTTYAVEVRKSAWIHTAGRTDFQTGAFAGTDGFDDASIAALCEALGD